MPHNNAAPGAITANAQTVALDTTGQSAAVIELSGTWVGTIQFEYTPDGTNWYALVAYPIGVTAQAAVTSAVANGVWRADVAAFPAIRVRSSAWTSGTATVQIEASAAAWTGGITATVATIADGADVAQGATTDAATTTGNGTVIGHLRRIRDLLDPAVTPTGTVTVTDTATEAALGATADAAYASGNGTTIALLKGLFARLRGGQATMANSLPVALASDQGALPVAAHALTAGEAHIGAIGGNTVVSAAVLTRPADTTTYAAGDAVTNSTTVPVALTFPSCARLNAGSGLIIGATLLDETNAATKGSFELWILQSASAPTAQNDNAAFAPTNSDLEGNVVCVIPFTTAYVGNTSATSTGNAFYLGDVGNKPFVCGGGTTALFGLLVVRNAYTPISGEKLSLKLQIAQD